MLLSQIDISNNLLRGEFPPWRVLPATNQDARPFRFLLLDGNKELQGCIPVTAFSTVLYSQTRITGLCDGDPRSVEAAQVAGIEAYLPALLRFNLMNSDYDDMIVRAVNATRKLGGIVEVGQTGGGSIFAAAFFTKENPWGAYITIEVEAIEGVEYITGVVAFTTSLNLVHLPKLAQALPQLKQFACQNCTAYDERHPRGASDLLLPPELPAAAPRLQELQLDRSGIQGSLPQDYGNWPSLRKMDLYTNNLTGDMLYVACFSCHMPRARSQGLLAECSSLQRCFQLPSTLGCCFTWRRAIPACSRSLIQLALPGATCTVRFQTTGTDIQGFTG
jgi:hypothetical protein